MTRNASRTGSSSSSPVRPISARPTSIEPVAAGQRDLERLLQPRRRDPEVAGQQVAGAGRQQPERDAGAAQRLGHDAAPCRRRRRPGRRRRPDSSACRAWLRPGSSSVVSIQVGRAQPSRSTAASICCRRVSTSVTFSAWTTTAGLGRGPSAAGRMRARARGHGAVAPGPQQPEDDDRRHQGPGERGALEDVDAHHGVHGSGRP
jgi:hypothetical protein